MRKHTCHLDFRHRSLYVTIGQKNWVQKLLDVLEKKLLDDLEKKLLDNLEKKLLNSHEEKFLDKQNSSNQPNPKTNL